MCVELCTAKDIFELNDKKEYTLTATPILEKVLTDPSLTNQAAKLWQYLFSKAKYNHDLSIMISYSKLASIFNRDQRSIIRWVNSLKKNGYLLIRNNYDSIGGQLKNTFLVRVPKDVILFAKSSKDRIIKNENNNEALICYSNNTSTIEESFEYGDKFENGNTKNDRKAKSETDKTVMGEGDINVVHNTNVLEGNTNNNNTNKENEFVVFDNSFNSCQEALSFLSAKEEKIEREIILENKILTEIMSSTELDQEKYFEKQKDLGKLDLVLVRVQHEKAKINSKLLLSKKINPLEQEISYISQLKGERVISSFNIKRLIKQLSLIGFKEKTLTRLTNEITFEVRFGSLITGQDKKPLCIEKAINIALKLVREGRWVTPTKIVEFLDKINI